MTDVSLGIYSRVRVVPLFAQTVLLDTKERKKTWLRKIPGRRSARKEEQPATMPASLNRALLGVGFRGTILSSRFTQDHARRTKRKRHYSQSTFIDHQLDPAYARVQMELKLSQQHLILRNRVTCIWFQLQSFFHLPFRVSFCSNKAVHVLAFILFLF